ncbi:hypothetical protein [Oscillibacter sp.]|uniref:hypothetical protein n=1 Tax=Oscillibacter sp. TaxID=1945593 RepID=UPI00289C26AE|nr:hypothetical protein [Oscillibacter sp.]
MSAKQCRRLRTLQRERDYTKAMVAWLERKPNPIRFISYWRWKQDDPRRRDYI